MAWAVNLSCVNVSSMICMVRSEAGISGPVRVMFAHCMRRMLRHNCARHVDTMFRHVQLRIHDGMVVWCCLVVHHFLCLH